MRKLLQVKAYTQPQGKVSKQLPASAAETVKDIGTYLQGVRVGDSWKDRLDCRQWGAHFPHVAGIAGQSNVGAQSVVLSGG